MFQYRRWTRLLFGREFPYDDLLALWDRIFAEDPALDLVDMICVAMLLRIRWQCEFYFLLWHRTDTTQ
jgi:TBC1 domain family protein 5